LIVSIEIATIGFTKKSAKTFFTALQDAGVKRVVDVRLNNVSQLAGFSKMEDLRFFLKALCGIEYVHLPELAPTQDMLDAYKKEKGDWSLYEKRFLDLMAARRIEDNVPKEVIDGGLSSMQRGPATSLSPPARRRISDKPLGQCSYEASRLTRASTSDSSNLLNCFEDCVALVHSSISLFISSLCRQVRSL
jgi:hypothetical protein